VPPPDYNGLPVTGSYGKALVIESPGKCRRQVDEFLLACGDGKTTSRGLDRTGDAGDSRFTPLRPR
jgi:hypothetical protein